jgi:hypothetical protein
MPLIGNQSISGCILSLSKLRPSLAGWLLRRQDDNRRRHKRVKPEMIHRLAIWSCSDFVTSRIHAVLFILLALPVGIVLVALVPLGQVPDESAHAMRAESLWQGQLMGHRGPVVTENGTVWLRGGVITDTSIPTVSSTDMPAGAAKVTQLTRLAARATQWQAAPAFVSIGPIGGYLPVFYVPSALAIGAVRALGFGPYNAAIAGRLVNLGGYIALGAAALLVARRGRNLLFSALLLPISLFLAASLNEDGLLIATACLATALATVAWQRTPRSRRIRLAAAALIACIAVTKPPYLPLAVLLLPPFPATNEWRLEAPSLLRRLGLVTVIAIATVGWLAWAAHDVTTPFWRLPSEVGIHEPGPLWPGPRPANILAVDQAAQARVLLVRPSRLLTLPVLTMIDDIWRWRETIGVLGLLNVLLPYAFYLLWIVALAAAFLADLTAPHAASGPSRWLEPPVLLAACAATVLAIYLSQYLAWTPVGATRIEGPQGRYLVPLIPLVAVALPRFPMPNGRAIRLAGMLMPAAAATVGIFVIPATIVAFYYLGP